MSSEPKLRIAIIGGGIGGLTLAVVLTRLGVVKHAQIDIYEGASQMTQVGAGISLWHRGWEVLKDLELAEDLEGYLAPGQKVPGSSDGEFGLAFRFRKSDQKVGQEMFDLETPGGATSLHRADFQTVLLQHISSSIHIHLAHRLERYETNNGGEIVLTFTNGAVEHCDLLVGADGIKSVVRRVLAKEHDILPAGVDSSDPVWSGTYVYRSLIQSEVIRKIAPTHRALTAPMVHFGVYPVLQGKVLNVVAFVSSPERENTFLDGSSIVHSSSDDVAREFSGWEEDVGVLVENMESPTRWAIQVVHPLKRYAVGSVALLGDAAHAMTPHLGNGAGQAMEDAYILGHLLALAAKSPIPMTQSIKRVTEVYNAVRQPFGRFVQEGSRNQGMLYEFITEDFSDVHEGDEVGQERLADLSERIKEGFKWVWSTSPQSQLQEASRLFKLRDDDH